MSVKIFISPPRMNNRDLTHYISINNKISHYAMLITYLSKALIKFAF